MSMYYSMILVPADAHLQPAPQQIVAFIESLLEMGALGRPDTMFVRKHAPARVTRGRGERRPPETTAIQSAKELTTRLRDLTDFDVDVAGTGPARVLPIRDLGGFDQRAWKRLDELISSGAAPQEYESSVQCSQRSNLTSTSDLHDETDTQRIAVPFGEPCEQGDRVGLYSNPETMDLIQVPNAGCSSFWLAFTFGKWLFPKFSENRITFAEPRVLQVAEASFGTKFAEGCFWG